MITNNLLFWVMRGWLSLTQYIVRHWRGQLSLTISFWLNFFLLRLLYNIPLRKFPLYAEKHFSYQVSAIGITVLMCMEMLVLTWQCVGVWRAASTYAKQEKKWWGRSAKIVIVLMAVLYGTSTYRYALPQLHEYLLALIIRNPYQVRLLKQNTELEVLGFFRPGLYHEVRRHLERYPSIKIIHLNSEGGLVVEAWRLVDLIEKYELSTFTSTKCASACTIAFAAGRERILGSYAEIAFHGTHDLYGFSNDFSKENAKEKNYLLAKGVSADFVAKIHQVSAVDLWEPSTAELVASRFVTRVSSMAERPVSGMVANTLEQLDQQLAKEELYSVLKAREPDMYQKILQIFYAGYQQGNTLQDLRNKTFPLISMAVTKYLPFASDEAILLFTKHQFSTMQIVKEKAGAESCGAYLSGDPRLDILKFVKDKDFLFTHIHHADKVIRTSTSAHKVPTFEAVQKEVEHVAMALRKKHTEEELQVLIKGAHTPSEKAVLCMIMIKQFQEILALPQDKAVNLLRFIFDVERKQKEALKAASVK